MDIANLLLGKTLEDITSVGEIEIQGPGKVWAKNLVSQDIVKDDIILAVQDRKTKKYYIYAARDRYAKVIHRR